MNISRRSLLGTTLASGMALSAAKLRAGPAPERTLPLTVEYYTRGVYLDSASSHPISLAVLSAMQDYVSVRFTQPQHAWHTTEVRDQAVNAFARLVNAESSEIAIVPSTMTGENLISSSLSIGKRDKIVTDAFHYWASLVKYGEMRKSGVQVNVVSPRENRIALEDFEAAIVPGTRLVAVSLVASHSGFVHDLKALCELAHRRGALVYADLIQGAGAIPIDLKASGVDFACCGGQKWLQGDRGAAFLYVRQTALSSLRRTQVGWAQIADYQYHAERDGGATPPEGKWEMLPDSAASFFEVSTLCHSALWALRASIEFILGIGVDAIAAHRRPLMSRLHAGMQELGYDALAPVEQNSPIATFTRDKVDPAIEKRCQERQIFVTIGDNYDYIRVSPSVFNDEDDIDAFLEAART